MPELLPSWLSAPVETRADLLVRTGWIFAAPSESPGMSASEVIQKFKSKVGDYVHAVRLSDGSLSCTCPGWRKRGKCWHMHWVLRFSVAGGGELGRFLVRVPDDEDLDWCRRNGAFGAWFDDHVAVVPLELRPFQETSEQATFRKFPKAEPGA